jgi:hypothetical protein
MGSVGLERHWVRVRAENYDKMGTRVMQFAHNREWLATKFRPLSILFKGVCIISVVVYESWSCKFVEPTSIADGRVG